MSMDFLKTLRSDGVVSDGPVSLKPMSGGVSSDIFLVEDGNRKFVVKRALEKLKVNADWFADTGRNETEKDYLQYVAEENPLAVPRILASGNGYFAMEFLGDGFVNWKQALLAGQFEVGWAEMAGAFLGGIHRRSKMNETVAARFDKLESFRQLRIDPYLIATGERHPDVRSLFFAEAKRLKEERSALVHGDFSPKNMLISGDRLVVLDCEVACYADPAFDVAFLLTHFFLKVLYHQNHYLEAGKMIRAFLASYGTVAFELEYRIARLLLMLLLARVDGKSPVEYLVDERKKAFVRQFAKKGLFAENHHLELLMEKWFAGVGELKP